MEIIDVGERKPIIDNKEMILNINKWEEDNDYSQLGDYADY